MFWDKKIINRFEKELDKMKAENDKNDEGLKEMQENLDEMKRLTKQLSLVLPHHRENLSTEEEQNQMEQEISVLRTLRKNSNNSKSVIKAIHYTIPNYTMENSEKGNDLLSDAGLAYKTKFKFILPEFFKDCTNVRLLVDLSGMTNYLLTFENGDSERTFAKYSDNDCPDVEAINDVIFEYKGNTYVSPIAGCELTDSDNDKDDNYQWKYIAYELDVPTGEDNRVLAIVDNEGEG